MITMNVLVLGSLLVLGASLSNAFLLLHNVPRKVTKILTVGNGGPYGTWGPPQFCSDGSYAVGYDMKIEGNVHGSDDTSMNGLLLRCESLDGSAYGGDVTSTLGTWGSYKGLTRCDNQQNLHHFLVAFALQVESDQGGGDDTEANYAKFQCRDFDSTVQSYELVTKPGHGLFGTWGSFSQQCDTNSAICGISTRVESSVGGGDDTSMNDVKLYCCSE